MKTYTVTLTYTLTERVEVEAESLEQAEFTTERLAKARIKSNEQMGCGEVLFEIDGPANEYTEGQCIRMS